MTKVCKVHRDPHPHESSRAFPQLHFAVSRDPSERLWGGQDCDSLGYVNQYGQSRKHIFDSVQLSLKRLQLDYIDLLQCSFPD
jgi:aryl-alcohol dehydrogenase-like predicted oxidoreductase